jgi:hypothetical protein
MSLLSCAPQSRMRRITAGRFATGLTSSVHRSRPNARAVTPPVGSDGRLCTLRATGLMTGVGQAVQGDLRRLTTGRRGRGPRCPIASERRCPGDGYSPGSRVANADLSRDWSYANEVGN